MIRAPWPVIPSLGSEGVYIQIHLSIIIVGFFAALFGGTNTQISGPTAPMTAVSMVVISGIIAANDGDVNIALPAILTVFIIAGLSQIGLGVLGLGKYISELSYLKKQIFCYFSINYKIL